MSGGTVSRLIVCALAPALLCLACGGRGEAPSTSGSVSATAGGTSASGAGDQDAPAAVDAHRLETAASDAADWMSYGRTYDEQRFSPLEQINSGNASQLKLAWHYDLPVDRRAQESTPLVIDGVMYVTGSWSTVFALDPASGKLLWSYDPQVPRETDINTCCDAVNRGVAAWNGKLYLGTLDGRLVALDAATGKPVWQVRTTPDGSRYTITGAPRVVKGKVIIGNAGGEMVVRGYVTAYDAQTGKLVWRFYTVPGEPGKRDGAASDDVLERIARPTWKGDLWWKRGGGGTVWDSIAYDPKLDLLYIGTDNGGPWDRKFRSPAGGDNLFIASIIALKPDTGEYVWHYQTTPGEMWDYSSVQSLVLADLTIGGQVRHVIMQAPKNGFFYVLDRATGKLISAQRLADTVNWAKGIDLKTGRPMFNPQADYADRGKAFTAAPGPIGAHNWEPMAFSPATRLVYIPVNEVAFPYTPDKRFVERKLAWNVGIDFNAGSLPQDPVIKAAAVKGLKGHLAAWDPVAQKEVWRVESGHPWNGGVLATAGNLVLEGNAMGELNAYRADTGERLWSFGTGTGILAPPITYQAGGKQYVAIEVGWGGAFGLAAGELALVSHVDRGNVPRVLAFALSGSDRLPPPPPPRNGKLEPRPELGGSSVVKHGKAVYHLYCGTCHGDTAVSGGVLPDLRYSAAAGNDQLWQSIVHDGALKAGGMVAFGAELSRKDVEAVRAYVVHRINESAAEQRAPAAGPVAVGCGRFGAGRLPAVAGDCRRLPDRSPLI
ncbi:MAG TPA: PQQ-dependent dehydrogenase, methanol/ethanol family [Steroidobacteraceae bacterium]|nr:PQQ-dependent dehydrogenase, methanol/ethanol family [Steroidobacteraceae bacterium]